MVVKKGMVLMVVAALGVAGCASGLGGGTYGRTEARRAMSVQYGVVESVRPVQLEGTKSPLGAGAGAVVGGVAGSGVGGGRGQIVGATVGAVAGGLPGQQVTADKQQHQRQQQRLARHAAGQRRQHRGTDGDAEGIQADQQTRRGQGYLQLVGNGRDQPDDDKFSGADGKRTEGEGKKRQWHRVSLGNEPTAGSGASMALGFCGKNDYKVIKQLPMEQQC